LKPTASVLATIAELILVTAPRAVKRRSGRRDCASRGDRRIDQSSADSALKSRF
jgi:hypothetical protein